MASLDSFKAAKNSSCAKTIIFIRSGCGKEWLKAFPPALFAEVCLKTVRHEDGARYQGKHRGLASG